MELNTLVLIALSLAADAFAVSLTSGFAIKHLKLNKALKIALFLGGFQAIMPLIGWGVGLTLSHLLLAIDHWIAFLLLTGLGGKMIYEACQAEDGKPAFNPLDNGTLVALAIATSLDALVVGFGFALLKVAIAPAAATIGAITFLLCFVGVLIGHRFGNLCRNQVEWLGGLILIAIGLKILLEHLFTP